MKICPVAAELFHADRRTDMTKPIVAFRKFSCAPNKRKKNVARMEQYRLPLLAFQYHPSEPLELGRPKQRWKYLKYLQGLEKQVLLDLNPKCILLLYSFILQKPAMVRFIPYRGCRWCVRPRNICDKQRGNEQLCGFLCNVNAVLSCEKRRSVT
jgi:hypothetical protein